MAWRMQEAVVASLVLLLCICAAPSFQVPLTREGRNNPVSSDREYDAVEVTKKLWDAKKLHRRLRSRRSGPEGTTGEVQEVEGETVASPPPNVTISAPKYILELYRNLSSEQNLARTQANTIRSLQTTSKVPVCGQYNFSLAALNGNEFIIKAELHLYMKQPAPYTTNSFLVVIEKFRRGHNPSYVTSREISPNNGEGWYMFRVEHTVQEWVNNMDSHNSRKLGFRLTVYPNIDKYAERTASPDCKDAPLQFISSKEEDEDHEPLLVIYSYDRQENLNLEAILNQLESDGTTATPTPTATVTESPTNERSKRSVGTHCHVRSLTISTSHLNNINFAGRNNRIILPERFNAGICGGVCEHHFPRKSSQHAALVHLLLQRRFFPGLDYTKYKQTCSPVRYAPVEFLVEGPDDTFQIIIRHNMKITDCDCLDVYTV